MDTLTAQEAQDKLLRLVECAAKDLQQYRITSSDGNAVLLPEETYQNLVVTLELLSTPGLLDRLKSEE